MNRCRSSSHIVTWRDPAGPIVEVAARGASAEEAPRLAELVTLADGNTPSLPNDALGPDTVPIQEGRGVQLFGFAVSGWSLQYSPETRSETLEDEDLRLLTITGSVGEPDDLQAVRFWAAATEPVEVRGANGLAYGAFHAEDGPFGVVWAEGWSRRAGRRARARQASGPRDHRLVGRGRRRRVAVDKGRRARRL